MASALPDETEATRDLLLLFLIVGAIMSTRSVVHGRVAPLAYLGYWVLVTASAVVAYRRGQAFGSVDLP